MNGWQIEKNDQAIKKNLLLKQKDDFVPAKIRFGDDTVKVKLRLKGDQIDHLVDGKKWSYFQIYKDEGEWGKFKVKIIPGTNQLITYDLRNHRKVWIRNEKKWEIIYEDKKWGYWTSYSSFWWTWSFSDIGCGSSLELWIQCTSRFREIC